MSNKELPVGTAAEKTTEADVPTSSPTIGNTLVSRRPVRIKATPQTVNGFCPTKAVRRN